MRAVYHWIEDTPWLQVPLWRIAVVGSGMWGAFMALSGGGVGPA